MGQLINIDNIYINTLLICISRKLSFSKLVKESDEEIKKYVEQQKEQNLPKGYDGLYFIEFLSRKMGSSLGDVYNLSDIRREEILWKILCGFDPINQAYGRYYTEDENENIEFQGIISILDTSDEKEVLLYYNELLNSDSIAIEHNINNYYLVTFQRCIDEINKGTFDYTITISDKSGFSSDYMYDSFDVWSGKEGCFAEFIDRAIKNYKSTHESTEINPESNKADKEETNVLEAYIWNDTKTVELLDKFEGFGQSNPVRYERIVIKNTKHLRNVGGKEIGYNLVIERGNDSDYVGDVTFTKFKKNEFSELRQYVSTEITDEIIRDYLDKDQFYRFSKPFLLRAQNSSNRTGYGWEWDWSGGYGDYTEGTLYGETTNYYFVGAYITSYDLFNP